MAFAGLRRIGRRLSYMQHEAVCIADGDLVAIHGRFQGLDENPLVGFDIYRVR